MYARLILCLLLAGLPLGSVAAPLANDMSREILLKRIATLQKDPLFANLKAAGGRIAEIVHYESGLYIRYSLSNVECVAQWAGDALKLDPKCPIKMVVHQAPSDRSSIIDGPVSPELALIQSAVRFVGNSTVIFPPVAKVLGVRKEVDRMYVNYLAQSDAGPIQCTVALISSPSVRRDIPAWLAYKATCDSH